MANENHNQEIAKHPIYATAIAVGADLVQISSHNSICRVCMSYEAKIFSISGRDKDFPHLLALPPFHSGCRHVATIVFREALSLDGTLDRYIAFSNGRTEEHPFSKGFIPISKRKVLSITE